MLRMQLIDEPDVLELLNNGRFGGEVEGYIMTEVTAEEPKYLGHALFRVQDGVTTVLDSGIQDNAQLDGIVRACVAAGEARGAKCFAVNQAHPPLAEWWQVFCKGAKPPAPVEKLFTYCEGHQSLAPE